MWSFGKCNIASHKGEAQFYFPKLFESVRQRTKACQLARQGVLCVIEDADCIVINIDPEGVVR